MLGPPPPPNPAPSPNLPRPLVSPEASTFTTTPSPLSMRSWISGGSSSEEVSLVVTEVETTTTADCSSAVSARDRTASFRVLGVGRSLSEAMGIASASSSWLVGPMKTIAAPPMAMPSSTTMVRRIAKGFFIWWVWSSLFGLFVSKSFDGVESCGSDGWVDSEE